MHNFFARCRITPLKAGWLEVTFLVTWCLLFPFLTASLRVLAKAIHFTSQNIHPMVSNSFTAQITVAK